MGIVNVLLSPNKEITSYRVIFISLKLPFVFSVIEKMLDWDNFFEELQFWYIVTFNEPLSSMSLFTLRFIFQFPLIFPSRKVLESKIVVLYYFQVGNEWIGY